MAPLTDPILLTAYKNALANRRFEGFVRWMEVAQNWFRKELAGCTLAALVERMWEHVESGGDIDQVQENRPEWCPPCRYHFGLRFALDRRRLYVETRLEYRDPSDPDDPIILIASVHDA